jgi:hypothetical protein
MIQLRTARLPGGREQKPLWLWASDPAAGPGEVTVLWQAYARRFDLEHNAVVAIMRRGGRTPLAVVVTGLGLSA